MDRRISAVTFLHHCLADVSVMNAPEQGHLA